MEEWRTGADTGAGERLTLRQAAARLGVSESAIRKRVERGTLRSDKGPDGKRYVYVDLAELGADIVTDAGADTSATHERDALISELRAHNATLREQLEAERQTHAEARRLIAAALERVPQQLEAESHKTPEKQQGEQSTLDVSKGAFLRLLRSAARGADAYDYPVKRVLLPTYLMGFVVVCIVASIGEYAALHPEDPIVNRAAGVFPVVMWGFGIYAGFRDGAAERFPFRNVLIAGIVTAVGATALVAVVSVLAQKGHSFEELWKFRNILVMLGSVIATYLLFFFGTLFARALAQLAAHNAARQEERETQSEGALSARLQAWVGLVGSIITALASFSGDLVQTFAGGGGGT